MSKSKKQRKEAYLRRLKACGFRSFTQANKRRSELIRRYDGLSAGESSELAALQIMADAHIQYRAFDSLKQQDRMLRRLEKASARGAG